MSFENGRLSATFLAALICLLFSAESSGQALDAAEAGGAQTGGAAGSRAEAGGHEAGGRQAPDEARSDSPAHGREGQKAEGGDSHDGKPQEGNAEAAGATAAKQSTDAASSDSSRQEGSRQEGSPSSEAVRSENRQEEKAAETSAETKAPEQSRNSEAVPSRTQGEPDITGATDARSGEVVPADARPAGEKPVENKAEADKPASEPAPEAAPVQATSAPSPAASPEAAPPASAPEHAVEPDEPKDATLTIASWGGGYGQAQERVMLRPFASDTGHKVDVVQHGGGALKDLEGLRNQVNSGKAPWDVVNLSDALASKACEEGLLQRLDPQAVFGEAEAAAVKDDFIPGAIQPCAIGSTVWSTVILYNKSAYGKGAPSTVQDLFDPVRFPGRRALPKGGKYVMELALVADGVEPAKVYETLASEEGQARALAKLGQIKNSVVWWEQGQDPLKLLASGKASMALAFSGQAFSGAASRRDALGFVWDGQIYHFDMWAIPKGAKYPRTARQFINYASSPERLAAQTKWFPYGPARLSALAKVGKHAELDIDMAPYLPTTRDNFKNVLAFNGQWWVDHGSAVNERLDGWLKTAVGAPQSGATKGAPVEKEDDGEKSKSKKHKSKERTSEGSTSEGSHGARSHGTRSRAAGDRQDLANGDGGGEASGNGRERKHGGARKRQSSGDDMD